MAGPNLGGTGLTRRVVIQRSLQAGACAAPVVLSAITVRPVGAQATPPTATAVPPTATVNGTSLVTFSALAPGIAPSGNRMPELRTLR